MIEYRSPVDGDCDKYEHGCVDCEESPEREYLAAERRKAAVLVEQRVDLYRQNECTHHEIKHRHHEDEMVQHLNT